VKTISERMKALKKSLDIDLLEDALGIEVSNSVGDEDMCSCPLPSHEGVDSNPSFSINRSKLVYNCFTCGVGGNIIDLVARILDLDYEDAYKFCRNHKDNTLGKDDPFAYGRQLQQIFDSQKESKISKPMPRYSRSILNDWLENYCEYLEHRGINQDSQDKFMLGFDPQHTRADYTGPAVIIPHFFENNLVGYQERWTDDDRPKNIPKYTNSKNFPKAETLFAFDSAIKGNNSPVIVVESALTAVYLDQLGYPSVATFGASVSDEQIRLLRSFSWGVTLSFDNDAAGRQACGMLCDRLHKTIPIHITEEFGEHKQDLNDLSKNEVEKVITNAKPWFMKGV